jgi:hypothetical protein
MSCDEKEEEFFALEVTAILVSIDADVRHYRLDARSARRIRNLHGPDWRPEALSMSVTVIDSDAPSILNDALVFPLTGFNIRQLLEFGGMRCEYPGSQQMTDPATITLQEATEFLAKLPSDILKALLAREIQKEAEAEQHLAEQRARVLEDRRQVEELLTHCKVAANTFFMLPLNIKKDIEALAAVKTAEGHKGYFLTRGINAWLKGDRPPLFVQLTSSLPDGA